jgi:hypothetical protein
MRREGLVRLTGAALIIVAVAAAVELAAFLYTTYLARNYGILFFVPHITEDYPTYAARVNPRLGWPSPQALTKAQENLARQQAALRPDSAPGQPPASLSAYGDSFTAGFGVEPEETWSEVLGARLGTHIANYGVPGFGSDQAYLRFQANHQDPAKIVFFGFLSENIQRNVNQLRNFLIPNFQCQTKPRFWLDDRGQLQLEPLPSLTAANYQDFCQRPEDFLKHDYFAPGGPSGAQRLSFPYTWSILRAYKFFYDRWVLGYKSYLQFYAPDHPSRALPVTVAILKQWHAEAQQKGQHPIVVIFPTNEDLRMFQQQGKFVYEPLLAELAKNHIEYIDLGTDMVNRLGKRHYMDIFSGEKYYHFNKYGNSIVADIIYDYFISKKYYPWR